MPKDKTKKNLQKNPSSTPQNNKEIIAQFKAEQFHGPVPHPSILMGYEEISPGFANRIIAMAESETAHRQAMEKKALEAEIQNFSCEAQDTKRGQIFGLIIGLATIFSGTFAVVKGYPWAGTFIGTGGVVGLVSVFIIGRKNGQPTDKTKGHPPSKEQS